MISSLQPKAFPMNVCKTISPMHMKENAYRANDYLG